MRDCISFQLENFQNSLKTFRLLFILSHSAPVELLCVHKDDFDKILKSRMQTKHEDIKKAIKRFEYFKNFTDEKVKNFNF